MYPTLMVQTAAAAMQQRALHGSGGDEADSWDLILS